MDVYVCMQQGKLLSIFANEKLARESWEWSYHACDGKIKFFTPSYNKTEVIFNNQVVGEIIKKRVDLDIEHM